MEAAWYLQQDGHIPTPKPAPIVASPSSVASSVAASGAVPAESLIPAAAASTGGDPHPLSMYLAVRNRAEHSESITGFTIDPVNAPGGWRRTVELPKAYVLAPGQILILDLGQLPPQGQLWARRWLWKDRQVAARKALAPASSSSMPNSCSVPLHLKVRLAVDGKSHDVPIDGGMPSYLADAWLADCVVPLPPAASSAVDASGAKAEPTNRDDH